MASWKSARWRCTLLFDYLGFLSRWTLAESHAGAAAVFVDEFNAGTLEGFTDGLNRAHSILAFRTFQNQINDASVGTRHVIVFVLNRKGSQASAAPP